ncbi:ATP-binding protein [Spirulina subsalsa]|uniref:sensor histidine kinase n=1 Tax=Spirulina subsalsa TaxID=54311 RepID=UPI00037D2A17|nr:ATP-binding protein [Spirulina subsalsa]
MSKSVSSFRRILLTRLFLVSVPVFLLGVGLTYGVTYRKGRSALLETARQNLTESAIRKGENISQLIEGLKVNLVAVSQSTTLKTGSVEEQQAYLEGLAEYLPTEIDCVQLHSVVDQGVMASTCGSERLNAPNPEVWLSQSLEVMLNPLQVQVQVVLPLRAEGVSLTMPHTLNSTLRLFYSVPIYDDGGELRSTLHVQSRIINETSLSRGSFTGYAMVINQQGVVLAHPLGEYVGRSVDELMSGDRLQTAINSATSGRNEFLHFEEHGVSLLAGYTAIQNPVANNPDQFWVVLAVTRLDDALYALEPIRRTLLQLLIGLSVTILGASFFTILYVARDLAHPLEKLTKFALQQEALQSDHEIPQNFKIWEFRQLASALNSMITNLKHWAEELEVAWREAQTANQLKSEFLTTISHELRTPLNAIIGSLRLVEDGMCDDPDEELEFLAQADHAAVHLLKIIDEILDLSKVEAGQLSVDMQQVNLGEIIDEVISFQVLALEDKGLKLNLNMPEYPLLVHGDPAKLRQVLINVLNNAIKFTKEGSITVEVWLEMLPTILGGSGEEDSSEYISSPSGQQVVILIRDTGIGIDPTAQNRLFRPFVMVDGSTTRASGGMGLGLAISRNLIELMGGKITLYSAGKDQGTTVKLYLATVKRYDLLESSANGLINYS